MAIPFLKISSSFSETDICFTKKGSEILLQMKHGLAVFYIDHFESQHRQNLQQALTSVTEQANCMPHGACCYQNIELKC